MSIARLLLFFFIRRIDTSDLPRTLSRSSSTWGTLSFRYLLSARSLRSLSLRRRVDRGGPDYPGRRELAARWLRLAAATVGRVFPLF